MKKIFILTGEPSGDKLASSVISKLKVSEPNIEYLSVGGTHLNSLGIKSIFDLKEITYIGFTSVLLNIFKIRNRINKTVDEIIKFNPNILFSVDSPDFTLRVAERVKKINSNIKTVHYVAPQVWVWRPGRVKKIKKFIDPVPLEYGVIKAGLDASACSINTPHSGVDEAMNGADLVSEGAISDDEAFVDVPQGDEFPDVHAGIVVRDRTAQNRPKTTCRDFTSPAMRPQHVNTTGRTNVSSLMLTPVPTISPGGASVRSTAWSAVLSVFGSPPMTPTTSASVVHKHSELLEQSGHTTEKLVNNVCMNNALSKELDKGDVTEKMLFGSRERLNIH